jgi:hypothetical protein
VPIEADSPGNSHAVPTEAEAGSVCPISTDCSPARPRPQAVPIEADSPGNSHAVPIEAEAGSV